MEAATLNPPDWLDRLVTLLIPPAAREGVLGDLHESCVTPGQYAREALRVAPFVIISQARRNLNLPAMIVQFGLLLCCVGSAAALVALPILLIASAYQPLRRPSPREALRGAILVSFSGVLLFLLVSLVQGHGVHQIAAHPETALAPLLLGMPLSPLLCGFRVGLIIGNDRRGAWAGTDLSMTELSTLHQVFLRKSRRRNLAEGTLLALSSVCWPTLMHWGTTGIALAAIYGTTAVFLLTETPKTKMPPSLVSLSTCFGQELVVQQKLRSFLWWLWLTPGLFALQLRAEAGGSAVMRCSLVAMLLWFLVTALNREGEGRMREQVRELERACERLA